jgi:two-component system, NtrC family, response regulator AtoC
MAEQIGANPTELRRGIERAVAVVTEELKKLSEDGVGVLVAESAGTASLQVVETRPVGLARLCDDLRLRPESLKHDRLGALIGACPAMQEVYEQIGRVARSDASIFITGETGTGKEVVAQTIHALSRRSKEAFLPVNCGAFSSSLVESELFGHERGSFTGADRRHRGFFERANRGTLFLDEIGEMPIDLQVKLLRLLETSEVTRVGGSEPIKLDVRVITATNRPLKELVAAGKLRKDLFYRLSVFPIALPPLQERGRDVELLAEHFLGELNAAEGSAKRLTSGSRERLCGHGWPGNLRELKNVIQRAFILAGEASEIEARPQEVVEAACSDVVVPVGTPITVAERQLILATLDHLAGDKKKVARALKISLRTLYARLSEYRAMAG